MVTRPLKRWFHPNCCCFEHTALREGERLSYEAVVRFIGGWQGLIWRRVSEARLKYEGAAHIGDDFIMKAGLIGLHGGDWFYLLKTKPVILCRRCSTRGGFPKSMLKSIQ